MGVSPTQEIPLSEEFIERIFGVAFSGYICSSDVSLWKRFMAEPIPTARIVLTTTGTPEEAERLARTIVEERLTACATLFPGAQSIYRLKGEVESANETMLLIKTSTELLADLESRLHKLHSYKTPGVSGIGGGVGQEFLS
jgi:periplasmic divalent cation tolerance protein